MKFTKTAKLFISLALAVIMIASLIVPAMAYQSAFKSGAAVTSFSQTAKDKMAAMKDGDNIFALGEYDTATYNTAAKYTESGLCQFVYQHNDGKWGRAIKDTGWTINGMANIGNGIIDTATTGDKPANCLYFGKKTDSAKKVNANAVETGKADSKYYTLCGWEFAADFTVSSFKIYFGQNAYADDFDILVGHLDGDDIVWEVAFSGNDMKDKFTAVEEFTNDIYSYEAEFCKTMEGRFIQIATKSYDGHSTENMSGYYCYVCPEFEVYSGEVDGVNHNVVEVPASATCTEDGLAAHYECDKCGTMFADAAGTTAITEADIEVAAALGHNFVDGECTRCGLGGGVITDEASFLAMDPAGVYSLANDITISESYASTFTGSFDGKGYSVTTTVPMFAELGTNANVHDFTVEGEIAGDAYTGAAAKQIKSGATNVEIYNVVNNADITGGSSVGGIVGYIPAGATIVTITDCENNGVISETTAQVGGIVGYAQGQELNIIGCTNNADLVLTASYGGGIIGRFGKDAATKAYICRIIDCVNNGDFTAPSAQCGGMIGYVVGSLEITDCVNTGDITNTAADAGGMLGKLAVKGKTNASSIGGFVITGCVNYGAVTGGTFAGGIVAEGSDAAAAAGTYTKSYKINNCANFGNITSTAASNANSYAGGIAAYMFGGSTSNGIQNCINTGDVTVKDAGLEYTKNIIAGGIIGYFSATKFYVAGNINAGKVVNEVENSTSANFGCVEIYWNANASAENVATYLHHNFALNAGDDAVYGRNSTEGEDTTTVFEADDLASGKVAYDVNTALGKTVFVQNIDNVKADPDETPLPFGDALPVYEIGDGVYSNYENGAAPAPTFAAQVAVGENISIILTVNTDAAVTVKDADGNDIALTVESADGPYVYRIYDITPQMMSDVFTISVEGADSVEFSIRDYCMSVLEKCEDEDICNFVENLLHYGAAAQVWADYNTENLADASLSAAAAPELLTSTDKKWVANREYDGNVKVTAAGMYFDFQNSLYFKTSGEGVVTYKVNGGDAVNAATVDGAIGGIFAELSITELAQVYEVAVYDNGTLVGTLTYSGLSFIYSNQSKSGARGDFAKSMLNLYYSAMALIAE